MDAQKEKDITSKSLSEREYEEYLKELEKAKTDVFEEHKEHQHNALENAIDEPLSREEHEQYLKELREERWEGYKEYRFNMFIGMLTVFFSWVVASLMSGEMPVVLRFLLFLSITAIPALMSLYYMQSLYYFKFRIALLSVLVVTIIFSLLSHPPLGSSFFS